MLFHAKLCANFQIFTLLHFWGDSGTPQFLDLTYKAPPSSRHLAKFRGDRPRPLGDFAPKPIAPKLF